MLNYKFTAIKSILVILASTLISLILFEIIASLVIEKELINDNEHSRRYMLFGTSDGASAFRNQGKIFTYIPNSTIQASAFYEIGPTLRKEYDYELKTNNFGLVQKQDIEKGRPSIIVLGDSFTEGQGATPWFYSLEESNSAKKTQLINGGLLGTGFAQWKLLNDQLVDSGIRINKVVIPFISDDYRRTIWNFPDRVLNCLGDINRCKGDEGYYPKPQNDDELFVEQLRKFRDAEYAEKNVVKQKRFFRKYFPSLHFIWGYIKSEYKLRYANPNIPATEALIKQYGNNIIFIHIPSKEEIESGNTPNSLGRLAREKINSAGGKFVDGFKICGLEPGDYFINDPHPNSAGYKKIAGCVNKTILELD